MQPQCFNAACDGKSLGLHMPHIPQILASTEMLNISTYFTFLPSLDSNPSYLSKHLLPTSSPEPLRLEIVEKSDRPLHLPEKRIGHSRDLIPFFSTFCQLFFWLLACKSSRPVELKSQ